MPTSNVIDAVNPENAGTDADVVVAMKSKGSRFPSRHHDGIVGSGHDLIANELLVWLLPTHMRTHRIKFTVILFALIFTLFYYSYYSYSYSMNGLIATATSTSTATTTRTTNNSIVVILSITVLILVWTYWYYHTTLYASGKVWMDPTIPATNRAEMHVPLRLFETVALARRAACLPQLVSRQPKIVAKSTTTTTTTTTMMMTNNNAETPNVLLLDDMNWKFQLLRTVEEALELVRNDTRNSNSNSDSNSNRDSDSNSDSAKENKWSSIKIPGNWMLQGFDDVPIYTNQKYPFPCRPPNVPRQNPTGCYRLRLALPSDWKNESDKDDQFSIMLHGIESACFVFWNGEPLGFFKDSRLPSEFFIPPQLLVDPKNREAVLHLVVARWSDGR